MLVGITTYKLHEFPDLLELTEKCIESVVAQRTQNPFSLIISDQRSNPETLKYLHSKYEVEVIHEEQDNFSRSLNLICQETFKHNYFCVILNNDTKLQEHTLQPLIQFARKHPHSIITAPNVNDLSAFLISKSIYIEVGPFDENLKGGTLEDWDYTERMKEKNMAFLPCSEFHVTHVGYATISHILSDPYIQKLREESLQYYRKKWGDGRHTLP